MKVAKELVHGNDRRALTDEETSYYYQIIQIFGFSVDNSYSSPENRRLFYNQASDCVRADRRNFRSELFSIRNGIECGEIALSLRLRNRTVVESRRGPVVAGRRPAPLDRSVDVDSSDKDDSDDDDD